MGKKKKKEEVLSLRKASGAVEHFIKDKLEASLRRTGAGPNVVERAFRRVSARLYPGMPTEEVYRTVLDVLRREQRHLAARYSLRRAIMQLGPSGFPFERFFGALLESRGYGVRFDLYLKGACVSHEVDILAVRNSDTILAECKFHNDMSAKCDVKVALYVYARSLDLKNNSCDQPFDEFWLVTNTKFTSDAIRYARCSGLKLLGWDYPEGAGLKEWIEGSGLHPITCLTSLRPAQKSKLLKKNVVLCNEVSKDPKLLSGIGLKEEQYDEVINEINLLLEPVD